MKHADIVEKLKRGWRLPVEAQRGCNTIAELLPPDSAAGFSPKITRYVSKSVVQQAAATSASVPSKAATHMSNPAAWRVKCGEIVTVASGQYCAAILTAAQATAHPPCAKCRQPIKQVACAIQWARLEGNWQRPLCTPCAAGLGLTSTATK